MATESSIQTAVWHIELGRGKRVLQWLLLVLVAVGLILVYTTAQFRGLEKREAMDMAQLARNIARGQGFTTYVIRPLSLWHLKEHTASHEQHLMDHPDIYNPPLYPLVLAGLFKLLPASVFEFKTADRIYGPERWVMLPFDQICLLLSVLLVYLWAKRLFDHRVALTAGLLLLFSDTLWSYGVSGLPTNFLMLLLLASWYCLHRIDQRVNPPEAPDSEPPADGQAIAPAASTTSIAVLVIASAVLMGLCFLTRYLSAFLMVPAAIYVARIFAGRRAGVWVGIYLAVFLAVIAPWLARNYKVSNSFLGAARYQVTEGELVERSYHPAFAGAFSVRHLSGRFLRGTHQSLSVSLKEIGSDYFIFFFAVGLMYGFRRRDTSRLRLAIVGGIAAAIIGVALFGAPPETNGPDVFGGNLLVLFLPLVAVYGVAFFYLLLDRIQFRFRLTRGAAITGFALLNLAPMIFTLLPPRRGPFPYPPYIAPYTHLVANFFTGDEVACSDLPWAMAWYGDRRTVWLPSSTDEFEEIHDFVAPKGVQFLLLTPYMLDRRFQSEVAKGEFKGWANVMRGQLPANFPLKSATVVPPENDQILIADRNRWSNRLPDSSAPQAAATNAPSATKPTDTNSPPPKP